MLGLPFYNNNYTTTREVEIIDYGYDRLNLVDVEIGKTKGEVILEFCKVPRTIEEVCEVLKLKRTDNCRSYLFPLIEMGYLKATKPKHSLDIKYMSTN